MAVKFVVFELTYPLPWLLVTVGRPLMYTFVLHLYADIPWINIKIKGVEGDLWGYIPKVSWLVFDMKCDRHPAPHPPTNKSETNNWLYEDDLLMKYMTIHIATFEELLKLESFIIILLVTTSK